MSAKVCRYAVLLCLIHSASSQGPALIAFNSSAVYSGQPVTLTCSYPSGALLVSTTMRALNGSGDEGYLWCDVGSGNVTSLGVFRNQSISGCPTRSTTQYSVSVTLTANSSLELNYTCTVVTLESGMLRTVTSGPLFLPVLVCPLPPKFQPSSFVFNDTDIATITCESSNGKPAALVLITVSNSSGEKISMNGTNSASLPLNSSSVWHNSTATCLVTNHICSNLTKTSGVLINHINVVKLPMVFHTNVSNITLDCSEYVAGYPSIRYNWTAPLQSNITESSYLNGPLFTVLQGQSGLFNCTATNDITAKSVIIVFFVSNTIPPTTTQLSVLPPVDLLWIIGLVAAIIVIVVIVVVLGVLCKRGHFSKGKKKPGVEPSGTDQRSDNGSNRGSLLYVYDGPTSWKTSTEHNSDADAFHLVDRHTLASYEVASHMGRALSTAEAPVRDRHFTEDIRKPTRLLIVAEGLVNQLSQKTLPTTTVVEYSDSSCSLNDIIEKVEKAVPRSSLKFKSVALLLRAAEVGVTLSKVDHAELNSSIIQKEKGEKVRNFMTHLSKTCLDERGGTRMDILNYSGKAPVRLSEGLTHLLGIPTTVSKDQFGVDTRTGEEGGRAVVADAYFDRNNLGEIVYAELQQPSVKPQAQPRQPDDRVIYSEIKR